MAATQFLKTRVSSDIKHRVRQTSNQELITESVWLKRLVIQALNDSADSNAAAVRRPNSGDTAGARDARLYVRLRDEDGRLLRERAAARGMPPATYVSVLIRSHLRELAPLPKDELLALKRLVAELGGIGRNLDQSAKAASQFGKPRGPEPDDLWALIKVAEALRKHVKVLLKANQASWRQGRVADGLR